MANKDWYDDEDDDFISKTQIKNEMHELQKVGARLLTLSKQQISKLPLSDEIIAAIEEDKRIKSHEAKRRHLQYMGKIMRTHDADAIIHALDMLDPGSDAYQRATNELESWRERILQDDKHLHEFLELHPDTDRQYINQLIHNAKKELLVEHGSRKNYKNLYQFIKQQMMP